MPRLILRGTLTAVVLSLTLAAAAPTAAAPPGNAYTVTPLVSNVPGVATNVDPNLVNGWGIARSATSPWWVADNGADKSTLYTSTGAIVPLVVAVEGGPTGVVLAGIPGNFLVASTASPTTFLPAAFIFASQDGKIRAWRGTSQAALVTADLNDGAIYTGLAIGQVPNGPVLYAADFRNARIDVFDGSWNHVTLAGSFTDPELPAGYAPFGIQTIARRVFVMYAKQDAEGEEEVAGQSRGFVVVYDLVGNLIARFEEHGQLNAPWGVALAPPSFGRFGGDFLVGNFGDGRINAYAEVEPGVFEHRGTLRDTNGDKLAIDGLWGLGFGNAGANGSPEELFFAAGPAEETQGLFGKITAD